MLEVVAKDMYSSVGDVMIDRKVSQSEKVKGRM